MATVHAALAVINIFPFGELSLCKSYQRLIFHNSQLTFPSVVVRNPIETARFCVRLTLIVCLKCIISYYMPIVRYFSFLLYSGLLANA